jgi:hypothetical protein
VIVSRPEVGKITRGSFLVRTELAQRVGYRHREYHADGLFVDDLMAAGAIAEHVPGVLYWHR